MKRTLLSAFALCSIFPATLVAQDFPYELTTLTDTYQNLSEATVLGEGAPWDDPEYIVPIGFNFIYFNNPMTELQLLGTGAQILGPFNNGTVDVIVPYFADVMNASETAEVSPMSYVTEGEPGSRIFKMEWNNVGFYGEYAQNESFNNITNFQLWLYEGSNVMEYRYGSNTIKEGDVIHYFFGKPTALLGRSASFNGETWDGLWTVSGNPLDPSIYAVPSGVQDFPQEAMLTAEPPNGTVYRFAPEVVATVSDITDEEDTNSIQIFPTPATTLVQIFGAKNEAYEVFDMVGHLIWKGQLNNDVTILNVADWNSGVYILRTSSGQIQRLMKK